MQKRTQPSLEARHAVCKNEAKLPADASSRPRIGIHCSTGGSLPKAALEAHSLGAETLQIFSGNPRAWQQRMPDPDLVARFRDLRAEYNLHPLAIHASYLINLAAPDGELRRKSIAGYRGEMERALAIGADYLIVHPGSYKGLTVGEGLVNVATGMAEASGGVSAFLLSRRSLTLLLENTAGAGAQLGGNLSELASIRELATSYVPLPIGFCLDTCHCYVSGYDIATERGWSEFLGQVEGILGMDNVPVWHANDAKMPLGSRLDRHASIGDGYIGSKGFRRIVRHPTLCDKAFVLETPVDEPGDDRRNVLALQKLRYPKGVRTRETLSHR